MIAFNIHYKIYSGFKYFPMKYVYYLWLELCLHEHFQLAYFHSSNIQTLITFIYSMSMKIAQTPLLNLDCALFLTHIFHFIKC